MTEGRLAIKKLTLHNFKSYSGDHSIGPFHKNFTSVVGPNGSGKSNVIDALLFVFGKRAKKLRMNRLSEMIHASSRHRNNTFAKVTVHFHSIRDKGEDGADYEVLPGSDFSVSRVAHANNRSEYLLNDSVVQFGQIAALLKSKGIDLDNNRFLILQGEVEMIAQMKPLGTEAHETGLLEYLEEIIGSDHYIERIQQLSEKLEVVTSERDTMQRRVRAVEQEISRLAERKGDAEKFLQKKAHGIRLRIQKHGHTICQITRQLTDLKGKIDGLQSEMNQSLPHSQELKQVVEQYRTESRGLERKCDDLSEELEKLGKEISGAECVHVKLQEERKHSEAELHKTAEKLETVRAEMQGTAQSVETARSEIQKLETAMEAMSNNQLAQEKRLEELRNQFSTELAALNSELSRARLAAAPHRQKLAEIEGLLQVKGTEQQALREKTQAPQREADEIERRLEISKGQHQRSTAHIMTRQQEITQQKKAIKDAERAVQREQRMVERLEDEVERADAAMAEAKSAASSLSHQNAKMKVLVEARSSGGTTGIHGRLGDLGSIDARYDVAISNCCSALDYVVVETVEDAEAAGELLKQRKMSPMTFLILDKQIHLQQRSRAPFQAPEGSARLFDLIKVQDDKLRVAFYYGLRDTLVTDTLENATRIAFGTAGRRYNAVTLKGEVLSEVGAMTGGGVPQKGKMRLGEAPVHSMLNHAEAAQAEEAAAIHLRETQQALQEAKRRQQQANGRHDQLKSDLLAEMTSERKAEVEAEAEEREIASLLETLQEKRTKTQVSREDGRHLGALEKEISVLEQTRSRIQAEAASHFEMVQVAELRVENVGDGALKQLSTNIAKIKDELSKDRALIVQHQWTIENAPKKAAELAKNEKQVQTKGQQLERQLCAHEKNLNAAQERVHQLTACREEQRQVMAEEQEKLKGIKKQVDENVAAAKAHQEKEDQLKSQIEENERRCEDENRTVQKLEAEVQQLQQQFAECLPDEEVPEFANKDVEYLDVQLVTHQIQEIAAELDQTDINLSSVYQYRDKKRELENKQRELDVVIENRKSVMEEYESAKEKRLSEFLAGFNQIKSQLKRVYRSITCGGDADLELVDSFDPFSEGIEFSVRPPSKSWKKISNLSGGEKTLSSLSLIFALHYYRPTPLYVMDEIDAALDFRNVAIAANYIANRTKNAQFIVISLRSQMFDRAERLVGVYKLQDCSHSVSVDPAKYKIPVPVTEPPSDSLSRLVFGPSDRV